MGNVNENIAGKWERSWHCATTTFDVPMAFSIMSKI